MPHARGKKRAVSAQAGWLKTPFLRHVLLLALGLAGGLLLCQVLGVDGLFRPSGLVVVLGSAGLFALLLIALARAGAAVGARRQAEEKLRSVNALLDQRVRERTDQLLRINRQLTSEIADKSLAQQALKAALSETRQAKEKIDSILGSVSDALLVVDERRQVVLMNAAARELLCAREVDPVGRPLSEAIHRDEFREAIGRVLEAPEANQVFDLAIRREGAESSRVFRGRCSPVRGIAGGKTGDILLLQDVTRERELEQLKNDFLAMAAHELHTPITTIMGYSELLSGEASEGFDGGQRREFLRLIHQKAEALARIVDDLLDVGRMESGQPLAIRPETFVVANELEPMLRRYAREVPSCRFEISVADPQTRLHVDLNRFRQLIDNLVGNAVKYSPGGGTVSVSATLEQDGVLLCVADQGIGMTPEQQRQAFERFYRADTSTTAVSGTGLGLSVVRYIVEAHEGEIWLDSGPGAGTRVYCLFPAPASHAGD